MARSQAKSQAARRLMRELDAELAQNSQAAGQTLEWSAAERTVLQCIAAHVDRREELQAAYDSAEPDQVRTRIALATEIRLTESSVERMLRRVKTEAPQPLSITSLKARKAVNSRWDRERAARGDGA